MGEKKFYLLSWNDEWLQMAIEDGPLSMEEIKKSLRTKVLERLVELGVACSHEEAKELYRQAEESRMAEKERVWELHLGSDTVSIMFGSGYEEHYQIVEYAPA